MIRDIRYYWYSGIDCNKIINDVSTHKYNSSLFNEIAIYQIHAEGFGILSASNDVDRIAEENGALNKNDATVENIRLHENAYSLIFGNSELRQLLQYLIPVSPRTCYVKYGNNQEYGFSAFNISDKIRDNCEGVYLFTIVNEENEKKIPLHIIIGFVSVSKDNTEAIENYKNKGAKYFLYYFSNSEKERQEIILNIKNSEDYKYQIERFPDSAESEE